METLSVFLQCVIRYYLDKVSHQRCPVKKAVLKRFAILTVKHLCWSLLK